MAVFGDNNIIKVQTYCSGYGTAQGGITGASGYHTFNYGQTGYTGDRASGLTSVLKFTKLSDNSDLKVVLNMPSYLATGGGGVGLRLQYSLDGTNYFNDSSAGNGPADYWGATGYGGNTSDIIRMEYNSQFTDADQSKNIYGHTGTVLLQHQFYVASSDTFFPNTYSTSYYKYSTTQIFEIQR